MLSCHRVNFNQISDIVEAIHSTVDVGAFFKNEIYRSKNQCLLILYHKDLSVIPARVPFILFGENLSDVSSSIQSYMVLEYNVEYLPLPGACCGRSLKQG